MKKATASKNGSANVTKRLGPLREIVKKLAGSKKSRYIAVLSCGHKYSKGREWQRTHLRCRRCKVEGPATKAKKTTATAKKAA